MTRRKTMRERWTDFLTPAEHRILDARAAILAKEEQGESERDERKPYVRVRLGAAQQYGLPYDYIGEMLPAKGITPVPCTPAFVAGIVNRRGDIVAVLDLARLCGIDAGERSEDARIIVSSNSELTVGLLVDEVIGSETYDPGCLTPSLSAHDGASKAYSKGIHDGTITMLDLGNLLGDSRILVEEHIG